MSTAPSILILLHEHDGYPGRQVHQIWGMAEMWRDEGIDVRVAVGVDDPVAARGGDLVLPHVNLSLTPPRYREWLERQPHVLNPGVYDISKRFTSRHLVTEGDEYAGPVIVKTDFNFGGLPEWAMEERRRDARLGARVRRRLFGKRTPKAPTHGDLATARVLRADQYQVFDRKSQVPAVVFRNPSLVVEKFLPERRDGLFLLRSYLFLGDAYLSALRGGPRPVVKGPPKVINEECEPHPGILALRKKMGWDYGKFDFVVRDDEVILLDANRTPGKVQDPDINRGRSARLAPGIHSLFRSVSAGAVERPKAVPA